MHASARRTRPGGQTLAAANLIAQALLDDFNGDARSGIMVHLAQVGAKTEPPRFGQQLRAGLVGLDVLHGAFVEEPGHLRPALRAFSNSILSGWVGPSSSSRS